MKRHARGFTHVLSPILVFVIFMTACASTGKGGRRNLSSSTANAGDSNGRSSYQELMSSAGYQSYLANFHAHHFVEMRMTKKDRDKDPMGPGPCVKNGIFPEDDGRPCRDDDQGRTQTVRSLLPPGSDVKPLDLFKLSCDYAREHGGIDILYITAHSKNGEDDGDTSTLPESFDARHQLLKSINEPYQGSFLCGLGQEASSISTGNHMNILGQFNAEDASSTRPFFFPAGGFNVFYPEIKKRREAGEKIVLQLNHPDVREDLYWNPIEQAPKKQRKELLNDYGLDDYKPVACLIQGSSVEGCPNPGPTQLTHEMLRETYRAIRAASGDPFRMIEVVSPGGATENASTLFRSVHRRLSAEGQLTQEAERVHQGLYDWIYYLAMGFRVAPSANQDNHFMNYGDATASRTGVLARSLKESDVIDALDARRIYATEDRNARVILMADDHNAKRGPFLMGSDYETSSATQTLWIGYEDPDEGDREAMVRLYYYTDAETQKLDFSYKADQKNVMRVIDLKTGQVTQPASFVSGPDLIPIQSGQAIHVELPLLSVRQFVFAEITQGRDYDKVWTAPLWISRAGAPVRPTRR